MSELQLLIVIVGFVACLFGAFVSGLILGAKGWNAHVWIEPSKKAPVKKETSWPSSLPIKEDEK